MKVEFVLFAEAINRSALGTLNILGEFNTIYADEFPFVRPGLAVVIRLRGLPDEKSAYRIRAELVKQSSDIKLAEFESTASRQSDRLNDPIQGDIIVNAYGLVFPEPGEYKMDVFIDGTLTYSRTLAVTQQPTGSN